MKQQGSQPKNTQRLLCFPVNPHQVTSIASVCNPCINTLGIVELQFISWKISWKDLRHVDSTNDKAHLNGWALRFAFSVGLNSDRPGYLKWLGDAAA